MKTLTAIALIFICFQMKAQELTWDMHSDTYVIESPISYLAIPDSDGPGYFSTKVSCRYGAPKTRWEKWGHGVAGILYQVGAHSLNAVGDGYIHRGRYITHDPRDLTIGKLYNSAYAVMMFADYPLYVLTNSEIRFSVGGLTKRGLSSMFVRVNTFNPFHNLMIGERWNYIGNIDATDKFYRWTATGEYPNGDMKNGGMWPVRIISLGFTLELNDLLR